MNAADAAVKPAPDGAGRFSIFAVLVVAAAVRLHGLGARSVWLDEGFTWTTASAPLLELIRICATEDATPPLSYVLTGWFLKLGDTEVMLRMLSCLASIGLVWLTYRLARLFTDRTVAVTAALLTALSPFQVMYAQEARSYTLVGFMVVASTYFFLRASLRGRRKDWFFYAATLVVGLYTQALVALGLQIQVGLFVFLPALRRGFRPWLAALAVSFVLYVPWLVAAATQTSHLAVSHWYLEKPGPREIFHVVRGIAIAPIPLVTASDLAATPGLDQLLPRGVAQALLLLLTGVPALIGAVIALRSDDRGRLARVGLLGLLLPLGSVAVLSMISPRLLPRFFVFENPFLSLLTVAGIAALPAARLRTAWAVLLIALGFYGIARYDSDYTKERWREAVRFVDVHGMTGRKAALVTFDIDPFTFYNTKLQHPMPAFEYSHPAVPFSHQFTPAQLREMEQKAAISTRDFDEIWLLVRDPKSDSRLEAVREASAVAAQGRRLVGEWRWDASGGPVRVTCWRR
jgi:uncharacterized membrane protein